MQRPPQFNTSQFYSQQSPTSAQPSQPQTINPAALNFSTNVTQQSQSGQIGQQGVNLAQRTSNPLAFYSQRIAQSQQQQQQQGQGNSGQARPGTGQQGSHQQQGYNPVAFQLAPGMMQNQNQQQPQQFINPAQLLAGVSGLYGHQGQSQQQSSNQQGQPSQSNQPNNSQTTPAQSQTQSSANSTSSPNQNQNSSNPPNVPSNPQQQQHLLQTHAKIMATQQAMQMQSRLQQHQRNVSGGPGGSSTSLDGQGQAQAQPQTQGGINPMALMNHSAGVGPPQPNYGMIGMGMPGVHALQNMNLQSLQSMQNMQGMQGMMGSNMNMGVGGMNMGMGMGMAGINFPGLHGGVPNISGQRVGSHPAQAQQAQQPGQGQPQGAQQAQGQQPNQGTQPPSALQHQHQRQSSQTRTPTPHQSQQAQAANQSQGQSQVPHPSPTPSSAPPRTPHPPQGYAHPSHPQHPSHPSHPQLAGATAAAATGRPSSVASHHSLAFDSSTGPGGSANPAAPGSIGRPGSAQSQPPGNRPPSAQLQRGMSMGMGIPGVVGMNMSAMGGMNLGNMNMVNMGLGMNHAIGGTPGMSGGMMPPPLPPSHSVSHTGAGYPQGHPSQQHVQQGQHSTQQHAQGQPSQQLGQQQPGQQYPPQRPPTRPTAAAISNPMAAQPDLPQMHPQHLQGQQQLPGQHQAQGVPGHPPLQNRGGTVPNSYPGTQGPTVPSSGDMPNAHHPGMGFPQGAAGIVNSNAPATNQSQSSHPIIGPDGFPHFPGQPQPVLPMSMGIPGHSGVSRHGGAPGQDGLQPMPISAGGMHPSQLPDMTHAQAQATSQAQMRGSVPPSASVPPQIRSRGVSQAPSVMSDGHGQRHGTSTPVMKTEVMEIGFGQGHPQHPGSGVPGHPGIGMGMNGFPSSAQSQGPPHLSINMNNINMGMSMKGPQSGLSSSVKPPSVGIGMSSGNAAGSVTPGPDNRTAHQQAMANLPPGTDPTRTKVTEVPLASSGTLIPPLSPKSIEELKAIIKRDDAYAGVKRDMDMRMREELSVIGGPTAWWEKENTLQMAPPSMKFGIMWPAEKRRVKEKLKRKLGRRDVIRIPRKLQSKDADLPEILVPIRLEFDVDQHKFKETFLWNLNDPVVTPEQCAQTIVEDYKMGSQYLSMVSKSIAEQLSEYRASMSEEPPVITEAERGHLDDEDASWWESWRKRLRTEKGYVKIGKDESVRKRKTSGTNVKKEGADLADIETDIKPVVDNKSGCDRELRVILKLDIVVGTMKLDDQFEWDVSDTSNSPEQFAEVYTNELGLSGEFKTAVVHSIREQLQAYERSLFMLGNPANIAAISDSDFKDYFLPTVTSGTVTRNAEMAASFTPFLNVVDEIELAIGTEKEKNKRRKVRQTMRRRPNALPDRDAIRTHRTPAIGFPENDPTTLINGAMGNSTPATGRRAAAVAASSTIANMVASENGGVILPLPDKPASTPTPAQKTNKVRGLFKAPSYPPSALKPRSRIDGAIHSTALVKDTPTVPKAEVDDEGNPLVAVTGERRVTNKVPSAKRQKEMEREEKEREYAKRQHPNLINGIWHCSNCGCPDDIAIGRRKGPLGDKSQCGECGKYYHRYRKPREVVYNTDREYHLQLRDKNSKNPRVAAAARAAAASATPVPTPMEETPVSTPRLPTISVTAPPSTTQEPTEHKHKSPSSRGSSSEPLAASATKIKDESVAPEAPPAPPAPGPPIPPGPLPTVTIPTAIPNVTKSIISKERPEWLMKAHDAMMTKFTEDRFDFVLRTSANDSGMSEWWVKCLDCPQKFYRTGPEETLDNFEIHLRNRGHRKRVADRVNGVSPAPPQSQLLQPPAQQS